MTQGNMTHHTGDQRPDYKPDQKPHDKVQGQRQWESLQVFLWELTDDSKIHMEL